MRVIVNQTPALGRKTGIGHYTSELLRCLRQQAAADQIDAYPDGWVKHALGLWARYGPVLAGAARGSGESRWTVHGAARLVRRGALGAVRVTGRTLMRRHYRSVFKGEAYDLYHEPNYIPLDSDLPTVTTVCDLSALTHPEWHPADRVAYFEKHFSRALARSAHFFAISEFGRQEIMQTLNIPAERVTRTYMGVRPGLGPLPEEDVAAVLHQLGLPPRYLLYLSTIEPRKNVLLLLRAYCSLPGKLRRAWPLLLVGGWGWNSADVADYLHREARHHGVLHAGYIADEYVPALYNGARALVYPSIYEGFGLPPVEMMACGGAVLASTAGALVETVGSRACLVRHDDFDGWRAALARVVQDDDWWRTLRQGVTEVARPFTWDNCAADTLRIYRKLAGDEASTPARAA